MRHQQNKNISRSRSRNNNNNNNNNNNSMEQQFWSITTMDNLIPILVTTGCITVALFGTLIAIRKESKKR
jgi:hypothetical protein